MPEFCLTALKNLGNTCYMNSVIQALFATDEFLCYMLDTKCDKTLHTSLSKLFREMIECGEKDDSDSISPESFRETFVKIRPQFNNNNQQDSQEFLSLLLDGIHQEVNEAKNSKRPKDLPQPKSAKDSWNQYIQYIDDSFLVKLFVGHMSSTIECTECHHKSKCWDTFWDMSLSFPEKSDNFDVINLFEKYLEDETLDGDSKPNCENCETKTKSIKSLTIERLPLILTLNLKRFGNNGQKLSKNIEVDSKMTVNDTTYYLYACICHRGDCIQCLPTIIPTLGISLMILPSKELGNRFSKLQTN